MRNDKRIVLSGVDFIVGGFRGGGFFKKMNINLSGGAKQAIVEQLLMKTTFLTVASGLLCLVASSQAAMVEVDPARSRIQVDAKATGHEFTGDLKNYTIQAAGDLASHKPTSLNLTWEFNDLKTGDEKRDKEMLKWLGNAKPKGSFSMVKTWDETLDGGKAQGTLTLVGVSQSVLFPYTVKVDGEWVTLDGKVSIDYQNFKLPIIRAMAVMTVDPKLIIRFHVVGKIK